MSSNIVWMEQSSLRTSSLCSVSGPSIHVKQKFIYGLNTGVNVLFLDDSTIVYSASGVMVVHNIAANAQKFITMPPRSAVTAIDLNAINRALAVATEAKQRGEDDGEDVDESKVIVYDLRSLTSTQNEFVEPEQEWRKPGRRRIADLRFLYNNVSLAALVDGGDGSDCVLYIYSWRTSKIETYLRVDGIVADVALNPINTEICCFVGKNLFKLVTKIETDWSQYGFREAEGIDFTCVKWLCGDRCLAGTADGRIILFKNGVMQAAYFVESISELDVMIKAKTEILSGPVSAESWERSKTVRSCVVFEFGFVLLVGDSTIYYFQVVDNGQRYVRNNVYEKYEYWYLESPKSVEELPMHYVESACVSPDGRKLMCVTKKAQLHWAPLHRREDPSAADEFLNTVIEIEPLGEELHHGGVESLSTCLWKPLVMTCGRKDCTVKVWNYETCALQLSKNYQKTVLCVSIHPTGLFSVVAFSDRVEYQMIQFDDLVPMKTYQIMGCHLVAFSNSGHMFAVTKPNNRIDVYSSQKFEISFSCLGTMEYIESLIWCHRDMSVIVRDAAGTIFKFDPRDGKQLEKIARHNDAEYTGMAVTDDMEQIYVVSRDGTLREINQQKVMRIINLDGRTLNAICISKSNCVLFIATGDGSFLGLLLPFLVDVTYVAYTIHSHSITKMSLTKDNKVLITCSEDGSMCFWETNEVVKNSKTVDSPIKNSDDILIRLSELSKTKKQIREIDIAVKRMTAENAQFIDDYKTNTEKTLNNVKQANARAVAKAREAIEKAIRVRKKEIFELECNNREAADANKQVLGNLRSAYSDTLVTKYQARMKLKNQADAVAIKLKESLDMLDETHRVALDKHKSDNERIVRERLEEVEQIKQRLIEENNSKRMLLEDAKKNMDTEILDEKKKWDEKLMQLKDLNARTIFEIDFSKRQHQTYQKDTEKLRNLTKELEMDIDELKETCVEKKSRISDLSRLTKQSNDLLEKKEHERIKVKQDVLRLEKTLNILKERISESMSIIDPLKLKIEKTTNAIEKLNVEYNVHARDIDNLNNDIDRLTAVRKEKENELAKLGVKIQEGINAIKQMGSDMHVASQHYKSIEESKAKVLNFFDKYVTEITTKLNGDELAAKEEYFKQDDYLKRYIYDLETKLKSTRSKQESPRLLIEENTKLMNQMDDMRKESKMYFTMYNNLIREWTPDPGTGRPTTGERTAETETEEKTTGEGN